MNTKIWLVVGRSQYDGGNTFIAYESRRRAFREAKAPSCYVSVCSVIPKKFSRSEMRVPKNNDLSTKKKKKK